MLSHEPWLIALSSWAFLFENFSDPLFLRASLLFFKIENLNYLDFQLKADQKSDFGKGKVCG